MKKLSLQFYEQTDVVKIARELIGKIVVTYLGGKLTSGRIVETEAYVAFTDKASHSYNGRRTARNEHMYNAAGTAYIYICYGMHQMLNVVTNKKNIPDAILIRALEPMEGIEIMMQRTGKATLNDTITKGPGNVAKALGVFKEHSGIHLRHDQIYIVEYKNFVILPNQIGISKRIGVESAGEDALLPYRFYLLGNKFVSGRMR
jgi:DNA-3-methyladenine glycosylase